MIQVPRTTLDISTASFIRAAVVVLGIMFLWAVRDIALITLVAIVIASAVDPLVRWLTRRKMPRVFAVLLLYLAGIGLFTTVFYLLVPPLANDFKNFFVNLPALLETALIEFQDKLPFFSFDLVISTIRDQALNADALIQDAMRGFFGVSSAFFSGIISFILVVVISFYLAVQEDGIANVLRVVTPKEHEEYVLHLWARSQRKIGRWLQGQLLLGVLIGIIVFIMLSILQVRYALLLAILSAIFEIIPFVGPILAAIPGIAVATIQDPILGLLVLGIYILVQQIENHLIYPQVVRKTVGVHPLLAIIALLIGGSLAGLMGVVIAIPVAVVMVEYLNDMVERKKNLV
ncbi:MAG: AI-2E family transporter [Candidatus Ryanbacteria bacterium]|nr:AI-2E family transporter [Candidatus Ryanbacteria bacterium]